MDSREPKDQAQEKIHRTAISDRDKIQKTIRDVI